MGFFDDSAAKKAKAERNRKADEALARAKKRGNGSFLSWGGSGRAETKPGLFGLGSRVVKDIERENAKSGSYGLFGAKHVSAKAARAQRRGSDKSWWDLGHEQRSC